MIFLPNNFERYTAALRNRVHLSALKRGTTRKHLISLRKISEAEALYNAGESSPIDISEHTLALMSAASVLLAGTNRELSFKIEPSGVYLINKRLFTAAVLRLCKTADTFSLFVYKENIVIKTDGELTESTRRLIDALKGRILTEYKIGRSLIVLPTAATDRGAERCRSEWDYLLDPYSEIYVYID